MRQEIKEKAAAHSCRMSSWRSLVKSKMAAMWRSEITNSASVGGMREKKSLRTLEHV